MISTSVNYRLFHEVLVKRFSALLNSDVQAVVDFLKFWIIQRLNGIIRPKCYFLQYTPTFARDITYGLPSTDISRIMCLKFDDTCVCSLLELGIFIETGFGFLEEFTTQVLTQSAFLANEKDGIPCKKLEDHRLEESWWQNPGSGLPGGPKAYRTECPNHQRD